jgi:pimeloyl-ACP methyl ester carboxylesterase
MIGVGGARRALALLLKALLAGVVLLVLILGAFRLRGAVHEREEAHEAAPRTGRFVRAGDVELFLQEEGQQQDPAVVFVHGTGAWSETWRPALGAVSAAGFRGIAVDLPPFGYSGRPEAPRYGKEDQARRLLGALDSLGLDQVVVVGHSFGAGATVELALLAPGRVRALILVDAALSITPEEGSAAKPGFLVTGCLSFRPLRNALVATFLSNPGSTARLLRSFVADPGAVTPERVAVYQRPLVVKGTTEAFSAWLPALIAPKESAPSESPRTYPHLAMPIFLVWGERDSVTPLAQGERIRGLVPHGELEVVPGVGHIPQLEAPAAFNAVLVRLLLKLRDEARAS